MKTNNLGYPRIGEKRELKKAIEAYWKGKISLRDLKAVGAQLRQANWRLQKEAGIDLIPSNDFSFYDQMLDMTCLLGNVPPRFNWQEEGVSLDTLFLIARGMRNITPSNSGENPTTSSSMFASEMTKWFDTNYHFIVPEFVPGMTHFKVSTQKPFDEFQEALDLGIKTKPVLIGPMTYLSLGKVHGSESNDFNRFDLLEKLLPVYVQILKKLANKGAEWVQLDEPICSLDLSPEHHSGLQLTYEVLSAAVPSLKIMVANYFGELQDNRSTFLNLPVQALHIDAVRGVNELKDILAEFPEDKILSLGVVDGRNIWKNDYTRSLDLLTKAHAVLGEDRLMVAPSCSLLHSPINLRNEAKLDKELKNWFAFAEEKLIEISTLSGLVKGLIKETVLSDNQKALKSRTESERIHNPRVKARVAAITEKDLQRHSPFLERRKAQKEKLNLPLFPTTTIGSFPQTTEVRRARSQLKKREITQEDYKKFIKSETEKAVQFQEEIDIDMLVHGEFERNDMVEYFGEQLDGFTFTKFGWVQSYGSRCVKPPIIFGDVSRLEPMTVGWSSYAQSLTRKPMKGMLTGPVTILQWSFVRDDQPREETTKQIALAIRDEVIDLEKAGIAAIQIDEPAFREGLPLRQKDWPLYLKWAVDAFRLSSSGVKDETQIHTHMCYSEFNDIIQSIADLDADVISIETSRSNMELLDAFVDFKYPNEIGPGVYDIHSPSVPGVDAMTNLLQKAKEVLPAENIWVNPDCGLKTRQWEEVKPALKNMVLAAKALRKH